MRIFTQPQSELSEDLGKGQRFHPKRGHLNRQLRAPYDALVSMPG